MAGYRLNSLSEESLVGSNTAAFIIFIYCFQILSVKQINNEQKKNQHQSITYRTLLGKNADTCALM
jgi:hypothetical protein